METPIENHVDGSNLELDAYRTSGSSPPGVTDDAREREVSMATSNGGTEPELENQAPRKRLRPEDLAHVRKSGLSVSPASAKDDPPQAPADSDQPRTSNSRNDTEKRMDSQPLERPSRFSSLRLPQDFAANLGVKKLLTTVPVRKPGNQQWARVHPDEGYSLKTLVLELKEEKEIYLIDNSLWDELGHELKPIVLHLAVTRGDDVFLWPARLPSAEGRTDSWSMSALVAVEEAKKHWVRIKANMGVGAYDVYVAPIDIVEPRWPELTFDAVLDIAFKDRFIKTLDHPVIKRLRGES